MQKGKPELCLVCCQSSGSQLEIVLVSVRNSTENIQTLAVIKRVVYSLRGSDISFKKNTGSRSCNDTDLEERKKSRQFLILRLGNQQGNLNAFELGASPGGKP